MGLRCPGVGLSCLDPGVELLRPPGLRRLSPGVLRQPPHGPLLAALGCWRMEIECPQSTEQGFLVGLPLFFWHYPRDSCWVVWGERWVIAARRAGAVGTVSGHNANTCKVRFPPQKAELRYLQAA